MWSPYVPVCSILFRYWDQGNPAKCSKCFPQNVQGFQIDNLLLLEKHFLQTCEYQSFGEENWHLLSPDGLWEIVKLWSSKLSNQPSTVKGRKYLLLYDLSHTLVLFTFADIRFLSETHNSELLIWPGGINNTWKLSEYLPFIRILPSTTNLLFLWGTFLTTIADSK